MGQAKIRKKNGAYHKPAESFIGPQPMVYYDLVKNWHKIAPHLSNPELNDVLVRDFNRYNLGRTGQMFTPGMTPQQLHEQWLQYEKEVNGNEYDPREGPPQPHWRFVKHAACHWIVNFELKLAQLVEPHRPWRILAGDEHSSVYDGDHTMFEFNFSTFGTPPEECYKLAFDGSDKQADAFETDGTTSAGLPIPAFCPEEFRQSIRSRRYYNMPALATAAKTYVSNLEEALRAGAVGYDVTIIPSVMSQYDFIQKFISSVDAGKEKEAAKILQALARNQFTGFPKMCNQVEREAAAVLKKITKPGNKLAFVSPESMKEKSYEAAYEVGSKGIVNAWHEDPDPPAESLRKTLNFAISARWDWLLVVLSGDEVTDSYKFERFNAVRCESSKATQKAQAA
jgi:hypothetical protein